MNKETIKAIQEFGTKIFVNEYYIHGNIETFIKEMKNAKLDIDTTEFDNNLAFINFNLILIEDVIKTKKISENKRDLKVLGKYLNEISNSLIELGEE